MEGDGNCCFNAVTFSVISNTDNLTPSQKDLLNAKGIDMSMDINSLSSVLRKLMVTEWKQNVAIYQEFAPNIDVIQEADKFLLPGYHYGDLADTTILALANVLQAAIVVFSLIQYHPVFCITPRVQVISIPFMVAFMQCGSGHYDGILISTGDNIENPSKDNGKCSCGKNDKSNEDHCTEITSKYTTIIKCKCLNSKKCCSLSCY